MYIAAIIIISASSPPLLFTGRERADILLLGYKTKMKTFYCVNVEIRVSKDWVGNEKLKLGEKGSGSILSWCVAEKGRLKQCGWVVLKTRSQGHYRLLLK